MNVYFERRFLIKFLHNVMTSRIFYLWCIISWKKIKNM